VHVRIMRKKQPQRLREFGCPDIKDEDVRDVADRCRVGSEGPGGRKENLLNRRVI